MGTNVGISGAVTIGIYNQWSFFQYGLIFVFLLAMNSFPYLLEAYKVYKKYQNHDPTEPEKERRHKEKMKEMEHSFLIRMKEIDTSTNNISNLPTKNFDNQTNTDN